MNLSKTKKGEKSDKIDLGDESFITFYRNTKSDNHPKFAVKYTSRTYNGFNIGSARKEDLKMTVKMIKNFKRSCPTELEFINRVKDSLNNPNTHSIIGLNDEQYESLLDYINDHF